MATTIIILSAVIAIMFVCTMWRIYRVGSGNTFDAGQVTTQIEYARKSMVDLGNTIQDMERTLPGKVLSTIQGSINPRKGRVAELITLMQLNSEYSRLIPLGQPVDFIGISEESVDFIEVKSGGGQLTANEKHIRDMVNDGKVRFITVRRTMNIDTLMSEEDKASG